VAATPRASDHGPRGLRAEALFAASSSARDVTTSVQLAEQMNQVAGEPGDNRPLAMSRLRL
jgi:hypothetical protein